MRIFVGLKSLVYGRKAQMFCVILMFSVLEPVFCNNYFWNNYEKTFNGNPFNEDQIAANWNSSNHEYRTNSVNDDLTNSGSNYLKNLQFLNGQSQSKDTTKISYPISDIGKDYIVTVKIISNDKESTTTEKITTEEPSLKFLSSSDPLPKTFDWRTQGMVTPVKNQEKCAAGWAFSATAAIESHRLIYLSKNESLSEQFLLDCDMEERGCKYSSVVKTFSNIVGRIGGVPLTEDYLPYMGEKYACVWPIPDGLQNGTLDKAINPNYPTVEVLGFRKVKPDEEVMAEFLHKHGPLAAAINSASMFKYKGGTDMPTVENCDPRNLNHSVLIVGYNTNNESIPYWIIKNSWGTEWGENGFYNIVRGRNACGIANDVSFAFIN